MKRESQLKVVGALRSAVIGLLYLEESVKFYAKKSGMTVDEFMKKRGEEPNLIVATLTSCLSALIYMGAGDDVIEITKTMASKSSLLEGRVGLLHTSLRALEKKLEEKGEVLPKVEATKLTDCEEGKSETNESQDINEEKLRKAWGM